MEQKFEVKPVGVKYTCDSCGTGQMLPTGKMKMFETHAMYPHTCDKCGVDNDFIEKYPLIRYEFMTQ